MDSALADMSVEAPLEMAMRFGQAWETSMQGHEMILAEVRQRKDIILTDRESLQLLVGAIKGMDGWMGVDVTISAEVVGRRKHRKALSNFCANRTTLGDAVRLVSERFGGGERGQTIR